MEQQDLLTDRLGSSFFSALIKTGGFLSVPLRTIVPADIEQAKTSGNNPGRRHGRRTAGAGGGDRRCRAPAAPAGGPRPRPGREDPPGSGRPDGRPPGPAPRQDPAASPPPRGGP